MRSSTWPSSSSASNRRIYSTGVGSRSITTLEALEEELERFEPQVVICGGHEDVEANSRPAWIELSLHPTQPTKISVGARYLERINPRVEALVEIVEALDPYVLSGPRMIAAAKGQGPGGPRPSQ